MTLFRSQTARLPVSRFARNGASGCRSEFDTVAVEKLFRITVDGAEFAVASVLPGMEREFAYGFLFTSGVIFRPDEVRDFILNDELDAAIVELADGKARRIARRQNPLMPGTACGAEPQAYATTGLSPLAGVFTIGFETVVSAVRQLRIESPLFKSTGAVHSCAIFDSNGGLVIRADDIGRHNAFDKAAGFLLLNRMDSAELFAATTGRLTSEIVAKAWRLGIPIVASPSCATTRAVEIAGYAGVALCGFVRGSRLAVYSAQWRITG